MSYQSIGLLSSFAFLRREVDRIRPASCHYYKAMIISRLVSNCTFINYLSTIYLLMAEAVTNRYLVNSSDEHLAAITNYLSWVSLANFPIATQVTLFNHFYWTHLDAK